MLREPGKKVGYGELSYCKLKNNSKNKGSHRKVRENTQRHSGYHPNQAQIELASLVLIILIVLGIAALDYENNCEIIIVPEMNG